MTAVRPWQADVASLNVLESAGVPVFAVPLRATIDADGGLQEHGFPNAWPNLTPKTGGLLSARPGMAFGVVCGRGVDVIDVDPKNGGSVEKMEEELKAARVPVLAVAVTPSGGQHFYIPSTGLRKRLGVRMGVDFLGGDERGRGRAFAFAAPTVRPKYPDGRYRWITKPRWDLIGLVDVVNARSFVRELLADDGPTPNTGQRTARTFAMTGDVDELVDQVAAAVEGERNAILSSVTFQLAVARTLPDAVLARLRTAALEAGLGPSEVDRTIENAQDDAGAQWERAGRWVTAVLSDPDVVNRRTSTLSETANVLGKLFATHGDVVGLSARRLAELLGVSHVTAGKALRQLRSLGWLVRVEKGEGETSSEYRMGPRECTKVYTYPQEEKWKGFDASVDSVVGHDAFIRAGTGPAFPRGVAYTLMAVRDGRRTVREIAAQVARSPATVRRHLRIAESAGLVVYDSAGDNTVRPRFNDLVAALDHWASVMEVAGRAEMMRSLHEWERQRYRERGRNLTTEERAGRSLRPSERMRGLLQAAR